MTDAWRVLDSGLRDPAQHIALDRALLEACDAGEIAPTLRFFRYAPSILLANRQCLSHECHLHLAASPRFNVQRRLTSGAAWHCGTPHVGFALYLRRGDAGFSDMQSLGRRICNLAAAVLDSLGVEARGRDVHEVIANGRQIGAAGGVREGDAFLYQGIIYCEFDAGKLIRSMRNPGEALGERAAAAAAARMCGINSLTGCRVDVAQIKDRMIAAVESEFEIESHDGELSLTEHARFEHALSAIDSTIWIDLVSGAASDIVIDSAAGPRSLAAHVLADHVHRRIKSVWFTRGSEPTGGRGTLELEAALTDTAFERIERNIERFFAAHGGVDGYTCAELVAVLRRALRLPLVVYPGAPRS